MPGNDEEIINAFATFDNENKGSVDADELRRVLTTMGEKMTDKEVDDLIAAAGGGSKVDYNKFVKELNKKAVPLDFGDDE